jgi:hypothetical protein
LLHKGSSMKLWILGEIINKANKEEWTNWDFYGIFLIREEALNACRKIKTTHSDAFFIVPVDVGELLHEDIVNLTGFEYIKIMEHV